MEACGPSMQHVQRLGAKQKAFGKLRGIDPKPPSMNGDPQDGKWDARGSQADYGGSPIQDSIGIKRLRPSHKHPRTYATKWQLATTARITSAA